LRGVLRTFWKMTKCSGHFWDGITKRSGKGKM
jgi:hypothetical protein